MNVRIYSWGEKRFEWMSEYIHLKNSTNIWANDYICQYIFEYIQISKYSLHTDTDLKLCQHNLNNKFDKSLVKFSKIW